MMKNAIEIKSLNKTYTLTGKRANTKKALDNVDISIKKGSIFGLLGPNGAGKSTIINIMAGLVVKSSGSVRIWDTDIDENIRRAKSAIGIVPQEINQDSFFTPAQSLDIQAGLYGVPKAQRRTAELLELVGLTDKADAYSRTLSGGMKRRLMVAKAMVHSPPILVLDEPTAGVDIELRRQLWDNVKALNARGVTIVLTTHYLEEAEELCDEIAIINHGKLIAQQQKSDLLARIENKELHFTVARDIKTLPKALEKFCVTHDGARNLVIRYAPKEHKAGAIIEAIQQSGLSIVDISTTQSDLEDVFLQLTQAA